MESQLTSIASIAGGPNWWSMAGNSAFNNTQLISVIYHLDGNLLKNIKHIKSWLPLSGLMGMMFSACFALAPHHYQQ